MEDIPDQAPVEMNPKEWGGTGRERVGDIIYWSIGGKSLYYHDKRPVLEAPRDKVQDGQIGAIPLTDLTGIWIFDEEQAKYVNNLEVVLNAYYERHPEQKETEMHR